MTRYSGDEHVNVGSGSDLSIADLARTIAEVVGFGGQLAFDTFKPDGTPRKLMDGAKLREMGWTPKVELKRGLEEVYRWYLQTSPAKARGAA
jgi:GDP-L-fucose synthase